MALNLEFLQDIQNVYSALTDLHVCITDNRGNQITHHNDRHSIFDLVGVQEFHANYPKLKGPILYEALPGINFIVCPIFLNEEIDYYIFAGGLIGQPSKQTIHSYLNRCFANLQKSDTILSLLIECNENELKEKINKIKKMSEIISEHAFAQKIQFQNNNQKEILQLLAENKLDVHELLVRFHHDHSKLDFIGYARRTRSGQFEIQELFPKTNKLLGTVFSIGEGLLGQAAIARKGKLWSEVEWDPRKMFFHKKEVFPRSIFCFPINREQEISGMFFGGSCNDSSLENRLIPEIELTCSLISIIESKLYWQETAMVNRMKANVANDIFQTMTFLKDINSVQNYMLDMGLSIMETTFSSFLFFGKANNEVEFISRGLTSEIMNDYKNELTDHFLKTIDMGLQFSKPAMTYTKCGEKILEILIGFQKNLYGYLCIGIIDEIKDELLSILKVLADAGGAAFHRIMTSQEIEKGEPEVDSDVKRLNNDLQKKDGNTRNLDYTISEKIKTDDINLTKRETEVLKLVLEGKNNREIAEILYISGHTVKNHMTNIFQKLGVNDRTQVMAKIYQMGFNPQNVI